MPIRARVCAWIAGFSLMAPSVAMGQDRTEREVVDLIVRDGPRARAIRAETDVTRREQFARLAYPNPGVTYSRESAGFTEFLQIEQPLPVFGVRAALSRAGVAATAAAEAERDARLWSLRADAAVAVARLIVEQERVEAADYHARDVERLIDVLRIREREGEGSRFDRLRAEQELRDARHAVTAAGVAVAEAKEAVTAMLPPGTAVGRVAPFSTSQTPPQLDDLIARAANARSELRALHRAADRAGHESDAARRARLPVPTVFGGLKHADDEVGRERGSVLGVSFSLPLFDTGKREAARWAAERTRIDSERAAIEAQIRGEITRAVETLLLRRRALTEDQPSTADELMRIAEVGYREGEVRILELLDAIRTSSRAKIRIIEIRLDARLAQIAVERAVGDVVWP
jgi:outer membrane protein TolC